tara:strand:+ start:377 stop:523 length:147 start_codon:yes stop_codon:yes gene_type:complete
MLPILFRDLSSPSKFERIDIFKIVKRNTNKNRSGIRVSAEILLKIKNK